MAGWLRWILGSITPPILLVCLRSIDLVGRPAAEDRVGSIVPVLASLPLSKALRKTHSYFSGPRPSIDMRISASFKALVKTKLVNCEP